MKAKDVMNRNNVTIRGNKTAKEAAELMASTQVSDLPVVDDQGGLLGVISEGDLIRSILPTYEDLLDEPALLTNFELIEERAALIENKSVEKLMIKDVITVDEETPVMKIASQLLMKKIKRIPVVSGGKLVGTVSRADICNAVISVSKKV